VFTFEVTGPTTLKGSLDWQGGGLDLQGTIVPASGNAPLSVAIVGTGRPNSQTTGWNTTIAPAWLIVAERRGSGPGTGRHRYPRQAAQR